MKIKLTSVAKRMMVHHSTPTYCWCSQDHSIYKYIYATKKLQRICRLPAKNNDFVSRVKDKIARSWPFYKLNNSIGIGHITELPDASILIFYDKIYHYSPASGNDMAVAATNLKQRDIATPLRGGIAVHPGSGAAYFGEYKNDKKSVIRIYRVTDQGKQVECCHRFNQGEIKHVHGVFWDKYRQRIWVTTGDSDQQCGFYFTDDEFKTLRKYRGGDQSWRAVALIPQKEHLVWGMDAGKDAPAEAINKVYSLNLSTDERVELASIGNPAYHAVANSHGIVLGVNFEPGRKQNTEEAAALWYGSNGGRWEKLLTLQYCNAKRTSGSQYAYIYLPTGEVPEKELIFTPTNVSEHEFQMLRLEIID